MTLLEKVTGSIFAHALQHQQSDGSAEVPVIQIADTTQCNGWSLYQHFLSKVLLDPSFSQCVCLSLEQPAEYYQSLGACAVNNRTSSSKCELEVVLPAVISRAIPLPMKTGSMSITVQEADLRQSSLTSVLQQHRVENSQGGVALFVDGISLLLLESNGSQLVNWVHKIQAMGKYDSIVLLVHADTLGGVEYKYPSFDQKMPSPCSVMDQLVIDVATVYLQALPAPPVMPPFPMKGTIEQQDNVNIGGVRIHQKKSNGTVLNAIEAVWLTQYGYQRGSPYAVGNTHVIDESKVELDNLTKSLTFNLNTSEKQKKAKDSVVQPYLEAQSNVYEKKESKPATVAGSGSVSGIDMLTSIQQGVTETFEEMEQSDDDPFENEEI